MTDPREIEDIYVVGTRMRLRVVNSPDGTVYKLGHKVRVAPDDPRVVMHTTFYLAHDEYEVLASLPGRRLQKTRFRVALGAGTMSIDVFHGILEGLLLAEVELESRSVLNEASGLPTYCIADVSRDDRFTGGHLANTDRSTLVRILEEVSGMILPA